MNIRHSDREGEGAGAMVEEVEERWECGSGHERMGTKQGYGTPRP